MVVYILVNPLFWKRQEGSQAVKSSKKNLGKNDTVKSEYKTNLFFNVSKARSHMQNKNNNITSQFNVFPGT